MKKIFFLLLLLLLSLSGCAQMTDRLKDQFRVDDAKIYNDSFTIRDKTIPLPPGDWRIAACGLDRQQFFQLYLIQEKAGKLFGGVYISVDSVELNREYGYTLSDKITKLGMHHAVINKNISGEPQDWWYVDNVIVSLIPEESTPVRNAVSDYIKSRNIIISSDMIAVWHRLTGVHPFKKRYLDVQYSYNPESVGFPPSSKADWKTSDWNAMRVVADPKKSSYISELIKQHILIHEQIRVGFHPDKLRVEQKGQPVASTAPPANIPIKQPPDNIKKEIKQKCASDFPSDYAQQAECVMNQEAGWLELNR